MGRDSAFILRVFRQWTHENVITKLASIIGVAENNMTITDMNEGDWRYPESRATSMSVMVHTRGYNSHRHHKEEVRGLSPQP